MRSAASAGAFLLAGAGVWACSSGTDAPFSDRTCANPPCNTELPAGGAGGAGAGSVDSGGESGDAGAMPPPVEMGGQPPLMPPPPMMDAGVAGAPGGPEMCADECDTAATPVCEDGMVTSCWRLPEGCSFFNTTECAQDACADESACSRCNNTCAVANLGGCQAGTLGTCVSGEDSCLNWEATMTCASGFCSPEGECGVCEHGCDTAGDAECADGALRTCVENEYGCRQWTATTACALGYCASASACPAGYALQQRGTVVDDEFTSVVVDRDGRMIVVGAYYNFNNVDADPVTTDAHIRVVGTDDNLLMLEQWGSYRNDLATDVAVTPSGDYAVTGWTEAAVGLTHHVGGRDGFVTKWRKAEDGVTPEIAWSRQWGSNKHDLAHAVAVAPSGDILAFGSTQGAINGNVAVGGDDLMLARFDAVGNRLWLGQWGSTAADIGTDIVVDGGGVTFVVGRTDGVVGTEEDAESAGGTDAFLQRLDSRGNVVFTRQWGTAVGDTADAIALTADGDLIVAGTTQGILPSQDAVGGIDLYVSRWTPDGDQVWLRQWGTTSDDRVRDITLDAAGRIYAAAAIRGGDPACALGQASLVVWDSAGEQIHQQLWDECSEEEFRSVAVDPNGRVLLAGFTLGALSGDSRGGRDGIIVSYQPEF